MPSFRAFLLAALALPFSAFAQSPQQAHFLGNFRVSDLPPLQTTAFVHTQGPMDASEVDEDHGLPNANGAPLLPEFRNVTASAAPAPDRDFQALPDGGTFPPDTNGSVGPDDVMVMINSEVRVQTKAGVERHRASMYSFWFNHYVFDPTILYDATSGRWIAMAVSGASPGSSQIFLALSQTSDPAGDWQGWSWPADPSFHSWADFPKLGFSGSYVVITANMVGSGSAFAYVIPKANFLLGTVSYYLFSQPAYTLTPSVSHDAGSGPVYLLTNESGQLADGHGGLRLYSITTSTMTDLGVVEGPDAWSNYSGFTNENMAPQSGAAQRVSLNVSTIINVVQRNGTLWASQHVFLPVNAPTRAAAQWWQITTTGQRLQFSRVDDPSGNVMYGYPSIDVNANNDVMLGFSAFCASFNPSAAYAFHRATDAPNTTSSAVIYKFGESAWVKYDSYGRNRWGDYSATSVDPANDADFWTIQEYAASQVSGTSKWGTWWTHVPVTLFPPFGAPPAFAATGQVNHVDVTWQAVQATASYELLRTAANEPWHVVATTYAPAFTDLAVVSNAAYVYRVRALNALGQRSPDTLPDAATTVVFSDDPVVPAATKVRATQVNELRTAVDALRSVAALAPASGSSVAAYSIIHAADVEQLRSGVAEARQQLGLAAIAFSDSPLFRKTIRAAHVEELRSAVK
jgi:hypothetical protein